MHGQIDAENPYCEIFRALNSSGCPYLVIGGIAVVLHGSNRFTPDVNIVLDFSSPHVPAALDCLHSLGLKPHSSLQGADLSSASVGSELVAKSIPLFKMENPAVPNFSTDIVLVDVGDFYELFGNSLHCQAYGLKFSVCGLQDLIAMKKSLNRPQDQMDVVNLELIQKVAHCATPEAAFEALGGQLPEGFDFNYFSGLFEFGRLPAEDKLNWLIQMLAALGGFCMFR